MTTQRGNAVAVFVILLGAALSLPVVVLEGTEISATDFLRGCLIALLFLPALVSLWRHGKIDFFFPPVLFSFIIFVGHVLPLSQFINGEDAFSEIWPYSFHSFQESLDNALLITILGVLGFYLGFLFPLRQRTEQRFSYRIVIKPTRLLLIGALYTCLGLGLFAVGLVLIGGPSALPGALADRIRAFAGLNYFLLGPILLPAFGLVWWIYLLQKRRPYDWRFWAYTGCAVLVSGLMGSRANTFMAILAGVILYHLLYRPISLPVVIVLILLGAIGLVGFLLYFREYFILGQIVSLGPHPSLADLWAFFIRSLAGEFYQIQALTILVDAMPDLIPFQHGSTYMFLFVAPIPSSIWSDKFQFSLAPGVFTLGLWPNRWLVEGMTVPTSLMGEMYLNFGTVGVVLGTIAFGALYKFTYVRARNRYLPAVLGHSLLLATMTHYIRGDFPAVSVLFLLFALPSYLALRFVGTTDSRVRVAS